MSKPFRVALYVLALVIVGSRLARLAERALAPAPPSDQVASPLQPGPISDPEAVRNARLMREWGELQVAETIAEAEARRARDAALAEAEARARRAAALAGAEAREGR